MFDYPYFIEILTPKRVNSFSDKDKINLFAERYYRALDSGLGISFPDNPMGQPRVSLLEMIKLANLPVASEKTIMNMNTFHTKEEIDELLREALARHVKYLLIIRGDGGPKLPKLNPQDIGGTRSIATSIDLLRYINKTYDGKFITGAAYNHYNPMPFESNRLKEKIKAGARFIITQPVIGKDSNIDSLFSFGLPVIVEAWMSKNLDLLFKSIRKQKDEEILKYDPLKNLRILHESYPDSCIYLSMLGYKKKWNDILPRL